MDSPVFSALAAGERLKIDGEEESKALEYSKSGNYSESTSLDTGDEQRQSD